MQPYGTISDGTLKEAFLEPSIEMHCEARIEAMDGIFVTVMPLWTRMKYGLDFLFAYRGLTTGGERITFRQVA